MAGRRRALPRSYAHVPRTILWLVPGGQLRVDGRMVDVEPFYLSKWPVTNEQFEAFDPAHRRSPLSPHDRDLAVGVSWDQASAYCRWYAEVSRKPMRLPTRTEWLYACLGNSAAADQQDPELQAGMAADAAPPWTADADAIDRCCWHAGNSEGRVQQPERRQANDFGLHGMLGSVWEWVAHTPPGHAEAAESRDDGAVTSPSTPPYQRPRPNADLTGDDRIAAHGEVDDNRCTLCGGSFRLPPQELRPDLIKREAPDFAANDTGFRVARSFRISG